MMSNIFVKEYAAQQLEALQVLLDSFPGFEGATNHVEAAIEAVNAQDHIRGRRSRDTEALNDGDQS